MLQLKFVYNENNSLTELVNKTNQVQFSPFKMRKNRLSEHEHAHLRHPQFCPKESEITH